VSRANQTRLLFILGFLGGVVSLRLAMGDHKKVRMDRKPVPHSSSTQRRRNENKNKRFLDSTQVSDSQIMSAVVGVAQRREAIHRVGEIVDR